MAKIDTRVYVPNKGIHDYSAAYKYGDLIFCTEGFINRKDILTMASTLNKAMEDAREDDYIMMTSLASLCSLACAIFAERFQCLNLLIFEDGEYIDRTIEFKSTVS